MDTVTAISCLLPSFFSFCASQSHTVTAHNLGHSNYWYVKNERSKLAEGKGVTEKEDISNFPKLNGNVCGGKSHLVYSQTLLTKNLYLLALGSLSFKR